MKHRWGDKEYHVRRVGREAYEVGVFTDHKAPDDVYTVEHGRCDCPGFVHTPSHHKHCQIVGVFQRLKEKPATFWFDGEKVKWRLL